MLTSDLRKCHSASLLLVPSDHVLHLQLSALDLGLIAQLVKPASKTKKSESSLLSSSEPKPCRKGRKSSTCINNVNKLGLQRSTSDKESINVGLLGEFLAVLGVDGSTVENAGFVCCLGGDLFLEPLAEVGVDFLGLFGGCDFAGSDGPDGLVGDDDLGPVFHDLCDGAELGGDDFEGLVGFALLGSFVSDLFLMDTISFVSADLKRFTAAQNDTETTVESGLSLVCDE